MELLEKSTFLRVLLEEVEHFDFTLFPPLNAGKKENEKVIGVCPEYLRKFYALAQMYSRDKDRLTVEGKYTKHDAEMQSELHSQMSELQSKEDLLREILWTALRAELHAFGESCIGIRDDWQVVVYESRGPEKFMEFIRERLGG